MKVQTITPTGNLGSTTVSDTVFGSTVNKTLLAQAIRVYLSNQRQGTSAVKTRSQVTRTTKKWFRQKGTGNARHGARSANIFVGGGVSHGPNGTQNWRKSLTQSMKRQALVSAFSAQAENIYVVDQIEKLSGKTKEASTLLVSLLKNHKRVLVVMPSMLKEPMQALRNIEQVMLVQANQVTALEVAMANVIVISSSAIKMIEDRLAGKSENTKTETKKTAVKEETKTATKKEEKVAAPKKAKAAPVKKTETAKKPAAKKTTKTAKK